MLVVGAGPAGLEAAMSLGRRGYEVVLAEATTTLGGRVAREARLPGLAAWVRVADYRIGQLERLATVEIARGSVVTAEEALGYGFDHIAVATGATWRRDGVGRATLRPLPLGDGVELLTPDDLLSGGRPAGERVVVYDDDHFYLGGVLAELLAREGRAVRLVTPSSRASAWTDNTMEQHRIQARLLDAGVEIVAGRVLAAAGDGAVELACAYTGRPSSESCDALVLVTARLPEDGLATALESASVAGGPTIRRVGDAHAPGTIAAAVWEGRRYAEELDDPQAGDTDRLPFRRERIALEGA